MKEPGRICVAAAMGLVSAGLGAAGSYAAHTEHIVPGCLVAFGLSFLLSYAFFGPRRQR